jgi:hypothetical protein
LDSERTQSSTGSHPGDCIQFVMASMPSVINF